VNPAAVSFMPADSRRASERESRRRSETLYFGEEESSVILLEVSPARPCDKE
jgi:hypothetical protein